MRADVVALDLTDRTARASLLGRVADLGLVPDLLVNNAGLSTFGPVVTSTPQAELNMIEVDVAARRIHLDLSEEEMARRKAAWRPPAPRYVRGYGAMFSQHIGQADTGCDLDFLQASGRTAEPEIH